MKHPYLSLYAKVLPGPGFDWVLVRCGECGAMEWRTKDEMRSHGLCRNVPGACPECIVEERDALIAGLDLPSSVGQTTP
jgi:hypothetical protein